MSLIQTKERKDQRRKEMMKESVNDLWAGSAQFHDYQGERKEQEDGPKNKTVAMT